MHKAHLKRLASLMHRPFFGVIWAENFLLQVSTKLGVAMNWTPATKKPVLVSDQSAAGRYLKGTDSIGRKTIMLPSRSGKS